MSQITKKALAASLKKIANNIPLSKIKVSDIVDDCNLNRQTFYYHFHDIYELLEWIYKYEALEAIADNKTYETWQEGFLNIFRYVESNKKFVNNTYHSLAKNNLEEFLYKEVYNLLFEVIEAKDYDSKIVAEDKIFIANFYKYAFTGIMLDWIKKGMKENPNDIVDKLDLLIHGDIDKVINNFYTN